MNKSSNFYLTLACWFYFTLNLASQSPIPIIVIDFKEEHETVFINRKGKEAFVLAKGHWPVVGQAPDLYMNEFSDTQNQPLDIFHDGIAVIGSNKEAPYWIDEKGKTVKVFEGKYTKMTAWENGHYIAWQRSKLEKNKLEMTYVNTKGENAFGERSFRHASPFSDKLAAVKELIDGQWGYIDKSGEMVLTVKGYTVKEIDRAYSFYNGLAVVKIRDLENKYLRHHIVINKKGDTVFEIEQRYPDKKNIAVGDYSNGRLAIGFARTEGRFQDYVFLNLEGDEVAKVEGVAKKGVLANGGYYIAKGIVDKNKKSLHSEKHFVLSPSGKISEIELEEDKYIYGSHNIGRLAEFDIRYNSAKHNALYSYSTNNFKEVFLTEELIKGYNENLVYNKNLVRYRLQTYEGKILWETPVGAWTITNNLVEALKYKKEVRRYELLSEDDFSNGLFELKDLEELKISFAKVEELPSEIAKLKKLKKLTIEWMRQLKTLPKELGELKKLEYLVVKNCEAYQGGLEDIIAQLPNLKKVELEGITLDKVFKAKLKTTRPDLIIVEEEVIFEDMMIEEY